MTMLGRIEYNAEEITNLTANNNVFLCAGIDTQDISLVIGNTVKKIPNYLFYPKTGDTNVLPAIVSLTFQATSICT